MAFAAVLPGAQGPSRAFVIPTPRGRRLLGRQAEPAKPAKAEPELEVRNDEPRLSDRLQGRCDPPAPWLDPWPEVRDDFDEFSQGTEEPPASPHASLMSGTVSPRTTSWAPSGPASRLTSRAWSWPPVAEPVFVTGIDFDDIPDEKCASREERPRSVDSVRTSLPLRASWRGPSSTRRISGDCDTVAEAVQASGSCHEDLCWVPEDRLPTPRVCSRCLPEESRPEARPRGATSQFKRIASSLQRTSWAKFLSGKLPSFRSCGLKSKACCRTAPRANVSRDAEEEAWQRRQEISGVVGRMVEYTPDLTGSIRPADDILALRKTRSGRVVVEAVAEHGPAHRAGVEVGDQLVAIDGWRDFGSWPLDVLLNSLHSPTTLVFVGFVGLLHSEVRVERPKWKDEPPGLPLKADVLLRAAARNLPVATQSI